MGASTYVLKPGAPALALCVLSKSYPFPEGSTQCQAPELGADSSHNLVVAMDKQGAEGPEPFFLQSPLRGQPECLQHNRLVIGVQVPHQQH